MRWRVYWRDDVDGAEELAREPATPPETCRQGERATVDFSGLPSNRSIDSEAEDVLKYCTCVLKFFYLFKG